LATDTSLVKQPSGCEVRILVGASPAVTACSLTQLLYLGVEDTAPRQNSVSGDVRVNFVACLLIQAGVRAPNRD